MNDLISRSALCHRINSRAATVIYRGTEDMITGKDSCNPAEWTRGYEKGIVEAARLIEAQPAVDAVEVVRCAQCKHYMVDDVDICDCYCGLHDPRPTDFCSYGAKMDGDDA